MKRESTQEQLNPLPKIEPHFPQQGLSDALDQHFSTAKGVLARLLPTDFYRLSANEQGVWLEKHLPFVRWTVPTTTPDCLKLTILCPVNREVHAEKAVQDLIRKWLIPEKEIHILGQHNLYFHMREISQQLFFLGEVGILVEDGLALTTIESHLPHLENELGMCLSSSKYLNHILDTKALTIDQSSSHVHRYLRKLTERAPEQFNVEIFHGMSTFFALSQPQFRKFRQPKLLTRVIVSHHLLRKKLLHSISLAPEKRHLEFRFIRSKLHYTFGTKQVLGLSVAVGLTDRYESFEDTHILHAVQKFIPTARLVKGSYYQHQTQPSPVKYIYLELEQKDGNRFSPQEIRLLKRELKEELKRRIEKLIPSVFMIRNEEEVMRNILLLSQELKYLSDLPQVMVNFDKQTPDELFFTILVVRVCKNRDSSLEKAFEAVSQPHRFLHDRVQNVGYIRKKTPKEANVFHLCIPKESEILRTDSSVNFYLAREKVFSLITAALGEVRDYNGGMILKQGELFSQFKHSFDEQAQKNHDLLENFFFSLSPIEAQATTSLSSLEQLFHIVLKALGSDIPRRDGVYRKLVSKKGVSSCVLRAKDSSLMALINDELSKVEYFSKTVVRTEFKYQGTPILGILFEGRDPKEHKQLAELINQIVDTWIEKVVSQQELRLNFLDLPPSLDPRLSGDDISSTIMKMLYDGLTRIGKDSKPTLAIANSVEISPNFKKYTFKLRPSFWSNGKKIVAHDFEYAWKKILTPSFYTPFAHFFYPIKNAKKAKEGKEGLNKVGVRAVDKTTLIVELEHPTPEFLEMTAHALYSPIQSEIDEIRPNWAQEGEDLYICNGPFRLEKIHSQGGYEFVKNPSYWDKESVKLDRIHINKSAPETTFEMFKKGEIDWIGRPLGPWESYFNSGVKEPVMSQPLFTHWCVFNVQRFPFDHLKMRQALNFALNRRAITNQLSSKVQPAVTPLPLIHSSVKDMTLAEGDIPLARKLFEEALMELGLTRETFPLLTLFYAGGELRKKSAQLIVAQWRDILGISCRIESYDYHTLFSKMVKGDFQIGTTNWKSWINDPIYTLNAFKYRNSRINFAKWEHTKYQELLDKAQVESVQELRAQYLKQAEQLLIDECPVLPIDHELQQYACKSYIRDAFCSESGNFDFKWASVTP